MDTQERVIGSGVFASWVEVEHSALCSVQGGAAAALSRTMDSMRHAPMYGRHSLCGKLLWAVGGGYAVETLLGGLDLGFELGEFVLEVGNETSPAVSATARAMETCVLATRTSGLENSTVEQR